MATRTQSAPRKAAPKATASAPRGGADASARAVARLTAKASPLRTQGLAMLVDFVFAQPLASYLDPARLADWGLAAVDRRTLERAVHEIAVPAWKRHLARTRKSKVKTGVLVSAEARRAIEKLLAEHPGPRTHWAEDAVDPRLLAQLMGPVLEELLLSLVRKLPVLGGATADLVGGAVGQHGKRPSGLGGLLRATVERRAGQIVEASKVVLGGLGVDVEAQVRAVVADVGQAATDEMRDALRARLKSKEGRAILARIQSKALDHILATPLAELSATVEPIPWDDVVAIGHAMAEHARKSPKLKALVKEEIAAGLAAFGKQTLGEVLEEAGLAKKVRADVLAQAEPLAQRFFAAPAFAAWLDAVIAD